MVESGIPNHPKWQAESQDAIRAELVRTALREVEDPELGLNVIELGLIRDLVFAPGQVTAKMILTTPFCPYGPAMLESVHDKIEQVTNTPTTVEMSPEYWDRSMMEEGTGGEWGLF